MASTVGGAWKARELPEAVEVDEARDELRMRQADSPAREDDDLRPVIARKKLPQAVTADQSRGPDQKGSAIRFVRGHLS